MQKPEQEATPETPSQEDGTAHLFSALGKQIKALREYRGLKQTELATMVNFGADLISAIERGVRTPQPEFLDVVDDALGAHGTFKAAIPDVIEALKKNRTRHPDWFRNYANLEAQSVEIFDYSTMAVPGLLQTESYARAVFTDRRPLLSEETIEKRVADRLDRQKIFEKWPAPSGSFIIEESVLTRPIGGPDVHRTQLTHLLKLSRMRTVEIQVMLHSVTEHPSLGGSFILLTPKGRPQVAYTETYGHPRLMIDREEVRLYADRYAIMRTLARDPDESRAIIEKLLGER
ncbi:helix-turn-helix domain-containing protein [Streptomyces sp. NPDC054863]